jgi:CubicO group peptidase (beta-lactamase class C family)
VLSLGTINTKAKRVLRAIATLLFSTLPFLFVFTTSSYSQSLPASLAAEFDAIRKNTHIGAVSYALVEGDQVVAKGGMGQMSLGDNTSVNADSVFRVGSITKTFTALALMKLVEENKVKINQPIKKLLPSIPLRNSYPNSPVTLAMMLEHTSGLTDLTGKEFNYPKALSLQQAFQVAPEARVVKWRPGYYKSYTNVGAGYVSAAIEKITKQDYDPWFNQTVLHGLAMRHSQLHWSKDLQQFLVQGYDSDLQTEIPYWHTLFRAFGGLNTTASDMSQFLRVMINEGQLDGKVFLSPSSIHRMETPLTTLAAQQGLTLGYGLGIRSELFRGHRIYQHGGDADGYLAHFGYNKNSKRGYFIVINAFKHHILREFKIPLNQWLIENLTTPQPPLVAKVSEQHLKTLVGSYQKKTYRFSPSQQATIEIKLDNNQLYKRDGDHAQWLALIPVSKWLFRYAGEPEATLAFVQTHNGDFHMQNGDDSFKKE